jgi:hypothetical protein
MSIDSNLTFVLTGGKIERIIPFTNDRYHLNGASPLLRIPRVFSKCHCDADIDLYFKYLSYLHIVSVLLFVGETNDIKR